MNAPLHPEIFNRLKSTPQADLPLVADCVLRYVWEGRFGPMLIEVRERRAFIHRLRQRTPKVFGLAASFLQTPARRQGCLGWFGLLWRRSSP